MSNASVLSRLLGAVARGTVAAVTRRRVPPAGGTGARAADRSAADRRATAPDRPTGTHPDRPGGSYPGDFDGVVTPAYAPDLDGEPDPGEIVWTWVPYEEDHTRGKDRPVLVVGHDGPWLLGLMLTSRDHDSLPGRREETWVDVGTGDWDPQRRASEVRTDRVLRLDPAAVRREGAVLDRRRFDDVAESLRGRVGW